MPIYMTRWKKWVKDSEYLKVWGRDMQYHFVCSIFLDGIVREMQARVHSKTSVIAKVPWAFYFSV